MNFPHNGLHKTSDIETAPLYSMIATLDRDGHTPVK